LLMNASGVTHEDTPSSPKHYASWKNMRLQMAWLINDVTIQRVVTTTDSLWHHGTATSRSGVMHVTKWLRLSLY